MIFWACFQHLRGRSGIHLEVILIFFNVFEYLDNPWRDKGGEGGGSGVVTDVTSNPFYKQFNLSKFVFSHQMFRCWQMPKKFFDLDISLQVAGP